MGDVGPPIGTHVPLHYRGHQPRDVGAWVAL